MEKLEQALIDAWLFLGEVSPEGWKTTVKHMKKHKDITNPFALAWSMKKKGYKSRFKR